MPNTIRQDLVKTIATLSDEDVAAVFEYVRFLCNDEEEEPTDEDIHAVVTGREEYARGEHVKWGNAAL